MMLVTSVVPVQKSKEVSLITEEFAHCVQLCQKCDHGKESFKFCKIFQNSSFAERLMVTASVTALIILLHKLRIQSGIQSGT